MHEIGNPDALKSRGNDCLPSRFFWSAWGRLARAYIYSISFALVISPTLLPLLSRLFAKFPTFPAGIDGVLARITPSHIFFSQGTSDQSALWLLISYLMGSVVLTASVVSPSFSSPPLYAGSVDALCRRRSCEPLNL